MGINGLTKFIRDKHPNLFVKVPLSIFRGKRIGIDVSIWANHFIQRAHRASVESSVEGPVINEAKKLKLWLERMAGMIPVCISSGVTPVFIFDGAPPEEKQATRLERRQAQEPARDNLKLLQTKWESTSPLDRTTQQLADLSEAMQKVVMLPPMYIAKFKQCLNQWGVPCWQSYGESDELCAAAAIDGVVSGVISTDSDLLVHGVSTLVTEWGPGLVETPEGNHLQVELINRIELLNTLEITHDQLQDVAFIAGTDYNKGLKGMAFAKAYKYIKNGNVIPEVLADDFPVERLRELFQYHPHTSLIDGDFTYDINFGLFTRSFNDFVHAINSNVERSNWILTAASNFPSPPYQVLSIPLTVPNIRVVG
jgi:flap endonuclease-1